MLQPGRSYSAGSQYRYGFNGKENDNEVKGEGSQQDYGMRVYDPRLGKFLSVDPIAKNYPELTPYQFASNRPIDGIDQDGLEFSKSEPYFLSPVGKYVVDYKVILSIPQKSNWSVSKDGSYLNDLGKAASNILANPNASGTLSDPIINVNISFKDDDNGTFKFSAVTSTQYVNKNTGETEPTIKTKWNDGTVFNEKVQATGWTKTMGDVVNNEIKFITFTGLMFTTNGKNDLPKSIDVMNKVMKLKDWARTLAHELGHTLGLHHPWDTYEDGADNNDIHNTDGLGPVGNPSNVLNNLLNTEGNKVESLQSGTGTELTPKQRKKIDQKLDEVKEPKK